MINIDESIKTKSIETVLLSAVEDLDVDIEEINIKLVSDSEIQHLNKEHSGDDKSTDVLSFPYSEDPYSGDIVIAEGVSRMQADKSDTPLENEYALLSLHGLLHILGYDHQTKAEQRKLDELQSKYLQKAGFVYRDFNWQDD